ncbi:hypothetical protein [Bifidobacterium angulatum]|uniref:hypothetical protein n=1 Tax=Bifidobacterium angulatum TaxID=1683 RepID=UPI00321A0589
MNGSVAIHRMTGFDRLARRNTDEQIAGRHPHAVAVSTLIAHAVGWSYAPTRLPHANTVSANTHARLTVTDANPRESAVSDAKARGGTGHDAAVADCRADWMETVTGRVRAHSGTSRRTALDGSACAAMTNAFAVADDVGVPVDADDAVDE